MPRVAPLYRFIKMYYLETRRMEFQLSKDAARQQALSIWHTMTHTDKQRFKKRMYFYDIEAVSWFALTYYDEIETSPPSLLREIAEHAVVTQASAILRSSKEPIFFLQVSESPDAPSYPEELTIIKFSLAGGIETYLHGVFDGQTLDKFNDDPSIKRPKLSPNMIEIRDHQIEAMNSMGLAAAIRLFLGNGTLFAQRSQMLSCFRVLRLLNLVDIKFQLPLLWVYSADELLRTIVGEKLSFREISRTFERVEPSPNTRLACDSHQACGRAEKCTLYDALLLTHSFAEMFAKIHRNSKLACFVLKSRPKGQFFTRNHKTRKPPQITGCIFDGAFRVPISE